MEKEETEQLVLRPGMIQQQGMKEGQKNPTVSGRRKMKEGLKKKIGREGEWHKIKYITGKGTKNFIIPDKIKSNGYSLNKGGEFLGSHQSFMALTLQKIPRLKVT